VDGVAGETLNYSYDFANRLTGVSGALSETYGYDSTTGNLSSKTGLGNYTYNTSHKHAVASATGVSFLYDANGNMTSRTIGGNTFTFTYDAENHMMQVKKNGIVFATFIYDGDGNRVQGTVDLSITHKSGLFVNNHIPGSSQILKSLPATPDGRNAWFAI
jgi:YD repeat-containing protein